MSLLANFYSSHWVITFLIFFPVLAAIICLALPNERLKYWAFIAAMIEFLVSLPLFWTFAVGISDFQNSASIPWIADWGISYAIGIDGISLLLILLTTFLMPVSVLVSWLQIKDKQRLYYAMLLLLATGMIGVFAALDLFLFYIFWEVTLIPMYFLIGVWGHERRIYAAVKFFLFTALGSLLMLVAIVVMYWLHMDQYGIPSLAYLDMLRINVPASLQFWLFAAFALAFAIKVPMVPFHTWLPDAHVEAPTAGSVLLAAVLLKMGVYGFLRLAIPLFPSAALSRTVMGVILVSALAGILYTAWVAAVQPNLKKLIAYTSVAHLGFIMVGTFALTGQSVTGGVLQSINHGFSTGALFILAGFLYQRRHTYEIAEYGGLAKVIPIYSGCLVVVALSSIAPPGLNGFVGEFLILVGSFRVFPWVTVLATTGVVFAAYYMLPTVRRAVWNEVTIEENRKLLDLSRLEMVIIIPLLIMIVLMGVYPKPFIDRIAASAEALSERVVFVAERDASSGENVVAAGMSSPDNPGTQ